MQQTPKRPPRVVIYTTQRCPHCHEAKRWLKSNDIPFLDFNVGKPGKIQKQFFQMGERSVPVIVIGDERLRGFNPHKLKSTLAKAGLLKPDKKAHS